MESRHGTTRIDQAWIAYESGHVRVITEPQPEKERKAKPPASALWEPSAYLTHDGRLYVYTSDGHAYAMTLN